MQRTFCLPVFGLSEEKELPLRMSGLAELCIPTGDTLKSHSSAKLGAALDNINVAANAALKTFLFIIYFLLEFKSNGNNYLIDDIPLP